MKTFALWVEYFLGNGIAYELPPELAAKVIWARINFKRKIKCPEPLYLMYLMRGPTAKYIPPNPELYPHSIIISQFILENYSDVELSGAIAHEMAHAERIKKNGRETREEWEVDLAALDFIGPEALIACHKRSREEIDRFFLNNQDFKKFEKTLLAYQRGNEEIERRIRKLMEYKNKSATA